MDLVYLLGLAATAAFAASGILAALITRIDLFGAVVVAVVTAVDSTQILATTNRAKLMPE